MLIFETQRPEVMSSITIDIFNIKGGWSLILFHYLDDSLQPAAPFLFAKES